jgi:hypothetical protein
MFPFAERSEPFKEKKKPRTHDFKFGAEVHDRTPVILEAKVSSNGSGAT